MWKKFKLFQKKPNCFPNENPSLKLLRSLKQKVLLRHILWKFLPKIVIFKNFRWFFGKTHLFSRNSNFFERFEFPWAISLFETRARRKMPRLPILEENLDLLKNNIYFSKKPKILIVLRFPKQFENLTCFLEKKWQAKCPWKLPRIFSEKNINFPGKSQDLDVLRLHKREQLLKRLLKESIFIELFWEVAKYFGKKPSLFPKNPNIWTYRELMSSSKIRDAFR